MKPLFSFVFFLCLILAAAVTGYSQQVLTGTDLRGIKISNLSDADILTYMYELKTKNLSLEQGDKIVIQRGLPQEELLKLRQRMEALSASPDTAVSSNPTASSVSPVTEKVIFNNKIFGADLFSTSSLSFQPDVRIATPLNYELGPDDQLQIAVFGLQEASFNLTVSPEGIIKIPNVGEVMVSGYTIERATALIRKKMQAIYTSLRSGRSNLSINLGKIRSIRVTVIGSTKPGTYEISSLSTLFNALYLTGGPSANGSYRTIELLRNNKVERKVDLYNFLLTGSMEDNVRLRENDIIRIPVYKNRVEIEGEVKRQGIFEVLDGESFSDLLNFTGGFTDSAYKASVKIVQLTDREKKVKDVANADFGNYRPLSGDHFFVAKILNKFANRITLEGAVSRPGNYEITPNLTLAQLIRSADGLQEDAYVERGQLIRLNDDLTKVFIPFNVKDVLNGVNDIPLKKEDRIIISSIFDLRDESNVTIQGEVRKPGVYKFPQGLALKDLILQAGGFTDAAFPQRIEIARLLRRDTLTQTDKRLSQIIDVRDLNDLSINSKNIELSAFDVVTVRRLPGYLPLQSVNASGQVQFPGPYVLQNRLERISDLLKRAGGLTPEAFAEAAYLRRVHVRDLSAEIKAGTVAKIQYSLKDSSNSVTGSVQRNFDQVPLDIKKILSNPGGEDDLVLKEGDELYIPRNDQEIRISGEVLFPTQATYSSSKSFKDYISDAGGFTDNARKKRAYILYPNGKAASTGHFLFFRSYPKVKPGSEIVVPKYIAKVRSHNTTEIVALATAAASLAYIIIAIFK